MMARGWESKSIEDQMSSARSEREARAQPALTQAEIELKARKAGLLLSRAKFLKDLEVAHNENYRALITRTLAYIDAELHKLDQSDSS